MGIIELNNVSFTYEGEIAPALRAVSCSILPGEFICIIGPSGCGKSTLLNLVAGLIAPSTGSLRRPERIGMTFQLGALLPWRTVSHNVALGLEENPMAHSARVVAEELARVNMVHFMDRYPHELSGGQRQRVGIARALAVDPNVLLLDEPFSALDPKTTAELHDDIIKIWRETKKTIVLVSHLIEEAVSLAGRVILMKEGAIAATYTIALPYPRRETDGFHRVVLEIRKEFFK